VNSAGKSLKVSVSKKRKQFTGDIEDSEDGNRFGVAYTDGNCKKFRVL
jgi:hypothetical protein